MDQEKIYDQNDAFEITPEDAKTEKLKKILTLIVTLVFFSGIYYYYGNTKKDTPQNIEKQTVSVVNTSANLTHEVKKIAEKPVEKPVTKPAGTDQKSNSSANYFSNLIKVTDKSTLAKGALASAGKNDPFSEKSSDASQHPFYTSFSEEYLSSKQSLANNLGFSSLSFAKLPVIGNLPQLSNFPCMSPYLKINNIDRSEIILKGFIGQKVIVSINGIVEALKVNDSLQNIKVIKIDPENLTAKFQKEGNVIVVSMTGLTDVSSQNAKLIRHLDNK